MAFDVFSQPQGPAISVSLFGDAAKTGALLGKEIPHPITSAIQGTIQGYQEGQKIYAANQEATLNDNKIAQIPIANQIQDQQAQQGELDNQAKILALKKQQANNSLDIATQASTLQAEANKAEAQNQFSIQTQKFQQGSQNLQTNQDKLAFLSDQNNQAVFAGSPRGNGKNGSNSIAVVDGPGTFKGILSTIDPTTLTPDEQAVYNNLKTQGVNLTVGEQNLQNRNEGLFTQSMSALTQSTLGTQGLQATGKTGRDLWDNVTQVNTGQYKTKPDGKTVQTDDLGNPVPAEGASPQSPTHPSYDYMYRDKSNPTANPVLIAQGITDPKLIKHYDNYNTYLPYENGSYQKAITPGIEASFGIKPTSQNQNTNTGVSTFATQAQESPTQNSSSNTELQSKNILSPEARLVKQKFNVDDSTADKLAPTIQSLKALTSTYYNDPSARSDPATYIKKDQHFETIARTISDTEFDNSPALQAKYTQSMVDSNRKITVSSISPLAPLGVGIYNHLPNFSTIGGNYLTSILAPYIPNTPKDLYYQQQYPLLKQQLDSITNDFLQSEQTTAKKSNSLSNLANIVGR